MNLRRSTLVGPLAALAAAAAILPASASGKGLARYVNPFTGTATGAGDAQPGMTFPGATMPFGMLQWGPDTVQPQRARTALSKQLGLTPSSAGGGYDRGARRITGFSLTHLSGAGCDAYGDFPFMPAIGVPGRSPARPGANSLRAVYDAGFAHKRERASPGFYRVRANVAGKGSVTARFAAAVRSGVGRFLYPRTHAATMLINAGGSAANDRSSSVTIDPARREVSGTATSGHFCAQRNRYTVHFVAKFNRPFSAHGTWRRDSLRPSSTSTADSVGPGLRRTAQAGAYVSFDTARKRKLIARVGISFVSVAGARANLRGEVSGRRFEAVRGRARRSWDAALRRVEVGGGSRGERRTLYTSLYHALQAPRTFSDADGRYLGMDGIVHSSRHTHYTDFSGWDIYRSEIQLLAMLEPARTSDMIRSLLSDARESGCLPKWPVAGGQTMEMIGDPADPIIASAAAFGARGFNPATAMRAMLRGAERPCRSPNGDYLERQGLRPYRSRGFIPFDLNHQSGLATSIVGSPNAVFGTASTSLEYASADFAIAQFAARFAGDPHAYRSLERRSGSWTRLVNRRTDYLEPRRRRGGFPSGYSQTTGAGFAEGDSAQYSWMVPFDLRSLFRHRGGRPASARALNRFATSLNATRAGSRSPHAYLGNEPSLATPWIFDWLGRPYRTQQVVRRALGRYFGAGPGGEPGEDDLGELSSWYVLSALGLYPEIPGVGVLGLAGPLFQHERLHLGGAVTTIDSPSASAATPYVRSLRVDGASYSRPWIPYCDVASGARLRFRLAMRPDRRWGSSRRDRPPSFGQAAPRPRSRCGP
jgi:predicted alpha-1,2-mannosidase